MQAFLDLKTLSFCLASFSATTASAKTIYDLGTLGGTSSFARSINDNGWIVGESANALGEQHGFLYIPWKATMQDLGTLGGKNSWANAVNNRGQVIGSSEISAAGGETVAYIWEHGQFTPLPHLAGQPPFSHALAINEAGDAVGHTASVAALWKSGQVHSLGTLGGCCSVATSINDAGVIVGRSSTATGEWHAFKYDKGQMIDLGSFGGMSSGAEKITNNGVVIGSYYPSGGRPHAFVIDWSGFRDLGVLEGYSMGFSGSSNGLVVGSGGDQYQHAVYWDWNRNMFDLGALPGSNYSAAMGVNNGGTIIGISETHGQIHAVYWH